MPAVEGEDLPMRGVTDPPEGGVLLKLEFARLNAGGVELFVGGGVILLPKGDAFLLGGVEFDNLTWVSVLGKEECG